VLPWSNAGMLNLHLAEISKVVAPGAHAAVIIDGTGYHGAGKVEVPNNITLVKLPLGRSSTRSRMSANTRARTSSQTVCGTPRADRSGVRRSFRFFARDPEVATSITTRECARGKI
jgi:hypothetical protein